MTTNVNHPSTHSDICVCQWFVWEQALLTFYLCSGEGIQAAAASTGASNPQECRSMQVPSTGPDQPEQKNQDLHSWVTGNISKTSRHIVSKAT